MTAEPIPPQSDEEIVPPTEEVHLPDPSYLPAWTAFGLTIALVGVLSLLGALRHRRGDRPVRARALDREARQEIRSPVEH